MYQSDVLEEFEGLHKVKDIRLPYECQIPCIYMHAGRWTSLEFKSCSTLWWLFALQQLLRPWNRLRRYCGPCRFCRNHSLPSFPPMSSWWSNMASLSSVQEHSQQSRIPPITLHDLASLSICMGMKLPLHMSAWTPHWWPLHLSKNQDFNH